MLVSWFGKQPLVGSAHTQISAALHKALKDADSALEEFVRCVCSAAGVADLGVGILYDSAVDMRMGHVTTFDAYPFGAMYTKVHACSAGLLRQLTTAWTGDLQMLITAIRPHIIKWDHMGETLLEPGSKELVALVAVWLGRQVRELQGRKGKSIWTAHARQEGLPGWPALFRNLS